MRVLKYPKNRTVLARTLDIHTNDSGQQLWAPIIYWADFPFGSVRISNMLGTRSFVNATILAGCLVDSLVKLALGGNSLGID